MSMLAEACGLTKASFYHHYSSKERLLLDVLQWARENIIQLLADIVENEKLTVEEKIRKIDSKIKKVFFGETIGCLMATTGTDVAYLDGNLLLPVQAFFDDWSELMARLIMSVEGIDKLDADKAGGLIVSDYEGAILLARLYKAPGYVENITARMISLVRNPEALKIYAQ